MDAATHVARPGGAREPEPDGAGSGRLWTVGKVLLALAACAAAASCAFAFWPVANPGVQDCGAPLRFAMTGDDVRVRALDPDTPPELLAYAEQPTCRARTDERLRWATRAFALAVAAGLLGAALGLIDDRLALRRAPPFESYLRERPEDAPGRVWDRPVVPVEDLGRNLPEVEGRDVVLLVGAGALTVVGLALVGGWAGTWERVGSPAPVAVVVLVACVPLGWLGTGVEWGLLGGDRSAERALPRGGLADRPGFGRWGRWWWAVAQRWGTVAVAWSYAAAVLPAFGGAGLDAHRRTGDGIPRRRALAEAGALVLAAAVVHAVLVVVLALVVVARGVPRAGLPAGGGWVVVAAAALTVTGAATGVVRWRQLVVRPDGSSWAVLRELLESGPLSAARFAVVAAALAVLPAVALAAAVAGVGGSVRTDVVVALALLAAIAVPLAPTPAGVGLVEAVVALGLWRAGLSGPQGAAAVIVFRAVTLWAPILPGWVAFRRLGRAGPS